MDKQANVSKDTGSWQSWVQSRTKWRLPGKTLAHHPTANLKFCLTQEWIFCFPDFRTCDFHGLLLTECALAVAYLCWILISLILWPVGKKIIYSIHSSVSPTTKRRKWARLIHRVILYAFDDKIHAICIAHHIVLYIVHCITNNCISPDIYWPQDSAHKLYVIWWFKTERTPTDIQNHTIECGTDFFLIT